MPAGDVEMKRSSHHSALRCSAIVLVVAAVSATAGAQELPEGFAAIAAQQTPQPAPAPPTPRHTGLGATLRAIPHDFKHLPSKENLIWTAIGGAAALAIHPADDDINRHFEGEGTADTFFAPGKYFGNTAVLIGSSLTIYAVGRLGDHPKVSHVGMDLIRAIVLDQTLTFGLKYATQRERPDHSDNLSFPSGHASLTFAVATALERHASWRMAVPAYLFASYTAMSRLHENRHYASDVVFGAVVGIIAGRTVTEPGSDKYDLTLVPVHRGIAMQVTHRWGATGGK